MHSHARPPAFAAAAWQGIQRACMGRLPTELWGAMNAVRRAISPATATRGRVIAPPDVTITLLQHTIPTVCVSKDGRVCRVHAVSGDVAEAGVVEQAAFPGPRADVVAALDVRPVLSLVEALVCIFVTGLVCTAAYVGVYGVRHPLDIRVGIQVAALATVLLTVLRNALLQLKYQALQRSETQLGDPDSLFLPIRGVTVHAKVSRATSNNPTLATPTTPLVAVHCYHGFGANTYSWGPLRPLLAQALGGVVSCHDMPGFGLTSRPGLLTKYSLSFNGALGRAVLDMQVCGGGGGGVSGGVEDREEGSRVVMHGVEGNGGVVDGAVLTANTTNNNKSSNNNTSQDTTTPSNNNTLSPPSSTVRVLMGHSLGCACVAAEVLNNPQGIDALVLIAPAIVAGQGVVQGRGTTRGGSGGTKSVTAVEQLAASPAAATGTSHPPPSSSSPPTTTPLSSSSSSSQAPPPSPPSSPSSSSRQRWFLVPLLVSLARGVLVLLRPLLVFVLRGVVRNKDFWVKGLQSAWYDKAGVTPSLIDGYRMPQLVHGWESGMLSFLQARMSILSPVVQNMGPSAAEGGPAQLRRLADMVQKRALPVLIIHGQEDALVPVRNSEALRRVLPGAELAVLPQCGHVPQEEQPQRVQELVCAFLQRRVVGDGEGGGKIKGGVVDATSDVV